MKTEPALRLWTPGNSVCVYTTWSAYRSPSSFLPQAASGAQADCLAGERVPRDPGEHYGVVIEDMKMVVLYDMQTEAVECCHDRDDSVHALILSAITQE